MRAKNLSDANEGIGGRYDLHTHSYISDGTDSPAEIARTAAALHLSGISLTDHDTTAGWDECRAAAREHQIAFLPGMEITTRFAGASTHLLAYGFSPDHSGLNRELQRVQESRFNRAQEMVRRLSADFAIRWAEVADSADTETIGRPHIADALVRAGYFTDRDSAFATVLGPASPYYVHTYAIDTSVAIRLVTDAGGRSVLAHPAAVRNVAPITGAQLATLEAAGLWGIEVHHPENLPERVPTFLEHARHLNLRVTGASDFHGTGKKNRLGECTSSSEVWDELRSVVALPE